MANRSIFRTGAMVLTLLATVPGSPAQPPESVSPVDSVSGINTGHLTPKQLRIWKGVEKIAEAADEVGQPLHPRLHSLWQWAKGNGHSVVIEMTEARGSQVAGTTSVEEPSRIGKPRVAVLWLNVYAIDNANSNLAFRLSDGLPPSRRLGKNERYAEIVGHELTHAFLILENPEYARLVSEVRMEADRQLLPRKQTGKALSGDTANRQRQVRLQSMVSTIEKPAEAAELEIWRELVGGFGQANGPSAETNSGWMARLLKMSNGN
jgi:hypothetical protein